MTNADTPTLATNDLIIDPVNPFTGNTINSDEKFAHPQYISRSTDYKVAENNGNTFSPSKWVAVNDNIWDKNQWTFINEIVTLSEHAIP